MTASDPAVAAAQRPHARMVDGVNTPGRERERITAAREALAPIKKFALNHSGVLDDAGILDELLTIIYPTNEPAQENRL